MKAGLGWIRDASILVIVILVYTTIASNDMLLPSRRVSLVRPGLLSLPEWLVLTELMEEEIVFILLIVTERD